MQLASQTLALELLGRDDAAQGSAGHSLGELDRDGGPVGEQLRHTLVVLREAGIAADLVVQADDPEGVIVGEQRDEEARAGADTARDDLVDLRIVEYRVDSLGPPPVEDACVLGAFAVELEAD